MNHWQIHSAIVERALSAFPFGRVESGEVVEARWGDIPVRITVGAFGPCDDAPMVVELWAVEAKPVAVRTWIRPHPRGSYSWSDLNGGSLSLPAGRREPVLALLAE